MGELTILREENKETRINSVELVEIINQFRELESELVGKEYKELQHKSFIGKIRTELEMLKTLGLGGVQNILPSSYINSQNKEQPCYSLNRDGMLQMLNSESVLVRFKTIEYINNLEEENKQLKHQLNLKGDLLLSIYSGGQDAIVAAKQLSEIEIKEAVEPLEKKIEEDKPLVEFSEQVLKSNDNILVRELAKLISDEVGSIGQNRLYEKLRNWEYIMKNKTEPYQKYIDNGYFVLEEKPINTPYGMKLSKTCKITPRGQVAIVERFRKELSLVS